MEGRKKPPWKNSGVVAFVAAVALGNFIVDVWLFKPENIVAFLIADAAILAGILVVAGRTRPPDDGGGRAGSGDVANLVP
jgi:hypothetical protein